MSLNIIIYTKAIFSYKIYENLDDTLNTTE